MNTTRLANPSLQGIIHRTISWLVRGGVCLGLAALPSTLGCRRAGFLDAWRPQAEQPAPMPHVHRPPPPDEPRIPHLHAPSPRPDERGWAEASENFAAGSLSGSDHWTFAVLTPSVRSDPQLQVFQRCLQAALALGPRFVVVMGNIGTTRDARFHVGQQHFDFGPDTVPVPLFLFPGTGDRRKPHMSIECAPRARLAFLRSDILLGKQGPERAEQQQQWLGEEVRNLPPDWTLLLMLTEAPEQDPPCRQHRVLAELLAGVPGEVVVMAPGHAGYSWWQWDRRQFITLAASAHAPPGRMLEQDGVFPGLLWAHLTVAGPRFRILRPENVVPVHAFSRAEQQQRQRLRNSLTSTPVNPRNPVSTIRLVNETAQQLEFGARWEFARPDVSVDPQILGFRLAPGEVFNQQFRFSSRSDLPLKFATPKLILGLIDAGTLAPPDQWYMEAPLWCRMTGELIVLDSPPVLDGRPDEWPGTGLQIDHVSQVVKGVDRWRGPNDLSAVFRTAIHGQYLYLAAVVHDDHPGEAGGPYCPRLVFYVGLDEETTDGEVPGSSPEARQPVAPLRIEIHAGSDAKISGVPTGDERIVVASIRSEQGLQAEVAVPLSLLPGAARRRRFLLDAAIRDVDPGEDTAKWLFYSGNFENDRSSQYCAIFLRAQETPTANEHGGR